MSNVFKGDLVVEAGKVYEYTEVTGNISSGGRIEADVFPVLKTNGGYIHSVGRIEAGAFPVLETNGGGIYSGVRIEAGAFPRLMKSKAR